MNNTNKIQVEECQYCIVIDKDSDYYKTIVFTRSKEGAYYVCDNGVAHLEKDLLPIIGNRFSFYINDKLLTDEAIDVIYHDNEIEFENYYINIDEIILDNIPSKNKLTNFNFY